MLSLGSWKMCLDLLRVQRRKVRTSFLLLIKIHHFKTLSSYFLTFNFQQKNCTRKENCYESTLNIQLFEPVKNVFFWKFHLCCKLACAYSCKDTSGKKPIMRLWLKTTAEGFPLGPFVISPREECNI